MVYSNRMELMRLTTWPGPGPLGPGFSPVSGSPGKGSGETDTVWSSACAGGHDAGLDRVGSDDSEEALSVGTCVPLGLDPGVFFDHWPFI